MCNCIVSARIRQSLDANTPGKVGPDRSKSKREDSRKRPYTDIGSDESQIGHEAIGARFTDVAQSKSTSFKAGNSKSHRPER